MNLNNGQPHPFEIVELCSRIASYLDLYDISQLCLVSKDFSQLFRPFLWSVVIIRGDESYRCEWLPWIQGLRQNGHLVKHAKLYSWGNKPKATVIENDDCLLASTLLDRCGDNLMSLTVVDNTKLGRMWGAVMKRIGDNRTLEGAQLLNGIRVLNIGLTNHAFNSRFRPLLTQPERHPEVVVVFAGVTELTLREVAVADDRTRPTIQEEVRYDLCGPIAIRLRDLVRLFPGVRNLTLDQINIDQSEDEVNAGEPSEPPAVLMHRGYYQLQKLDFHYCTISVKHVERILKRSRNIRSLWIGKGL
ncbi:hypothetical protein BGZ72_005767, partial [Mortierella alpina]